MPESLRSMSLSALFAGLPAILPEQDIEVTGLSLDSRQVRRGDIFLACRGASVDGLDFAVAAIAAGAVAIVCDIAAAARARALLGSMASAVPLVTVDDLARHIGPLAACFYAHPSRDPFVIGITGTNGKTSCSHYLAQVLSQREGGCGLIGTLGYGLYGQLGHGQHTTPDAVRLQEELAGIRAAGARYVVMEVSSHSLEQRRVDGVDFDTAVLTNLTREHLDYHGDMERYAAAKQRLFMMPGLRFAVINHDDKFGRRLLADLQRSGADKPKTLSFGFSAGADIRGRINHIDQQGFELRVDTPWGGGEVGSRLLGRFNASNLLATLASLLLTDMSLEQAIQGLNLVDAVRGRMEHFGGGRQPLVVVDYAHTPDALQQVLETLREHCRGRLWCVFGCGGNRDRGKRATMGAIAERAADHVVLTDDNPRHESGDAIVKDILAGISMPEKVVVERDRAEAIRLAVAEARADDVVLVAGKGHEEYQMIGDQIFPFSDRRYVTDLLGEAA
jgi:UDP-N-acetylmuramoyl-L-alanyl-D-glutamate--2,6-diaminopimelate ligase